MKKVIIILSILGIVLAVFGSLYIYNDNLSQIDDILDAALLNDDPYQSFEDALPKIQQFSVVKNARIDGNAFYVEFKGGGQQMWLITRTRDGTLTF